MENIYYLLLVSLCCWYFIYLRKISEIGAKHAEKYCHQSNLQFLSIARKSSRLHINKRYGIHWLSMFDFEFSGDGETKYQGELTLRGLKLENVNVPPYRIH